MGRRPKTTRVEVLENQIVLHPTQLHLPPRINVLWDPYIYTDKQGKQKSGLRLSSEGRGYAEEVVPFLNRSCYNKTLIDAISQNEQRKLAVFAQFCFAQDRTDVDACVKALLDAVTKWLGIDDKRVIRCDLEKIIDRSAAYGSVTVRILEARWVSTG